MTVKTIELNDFDGAIVFRSDGKKEEIYINDTTDDDQGEYTRFMVCYLAYAMGKMDWIKKFESTVEAWEKEDEKRKSHDEKARLKAKLKLVKGGDAEDKEDDS